MKSNWFSFFFSDFADLLRMSNNRHVRTTTTDVLSLRFNQDSSKDGFFSSKRFSMTLFLACFICATCDGIRIFNIEPFAQKSFLGNWSSMISRIFVLFLHWDVGRSTYAEMLYRTNLIAYVPADHVTGLPSNVGKMKKNNSMPMEILFEIEIFV